MTPLHTSPDDRRTLELVQRLKVDDQRAWEELYAQYHDELLFAIRNGMGQRLRDALQSEDVLQSVALEAFRALPGFEDRGPGSLRGFLHHLVRNKLRDRGRTFTAAKRAGAVPLTPSVESGLGAEPPTYLDDERYGRLETALAQLSDEMREVVILRRIEGLSSKQVAERLGRSDDATRKLYSRAIARLTLSVEDGA